MNNNIIGMYQKIIGMNQKMSRKNKEANEMTGKGDSFQLGLPISTTTFQTIFSIVAPISPDKTTAPHMTTAMVTPKTQCQKNFAYHGHDDKENEKFKCSSKSNRRCMQRDPIDNPGTQFITL